jgi:protein-L-isoaspartate(D-aspartate) O-methyltransferase
MTSNPPPSAHTLVEALKQRGELRDPRLEAAFLNIPREAFLPGLPLDQVYADEAIPIKRDPDGTVVSSSSQPSMMALMIDQLRLQPGMNLLEIGAGSGYNAALMQYIVGDRGRVTTIEFDPILVKQAKDNLQRAAMGNDVAVVQGDGAGGYSARAAYDRIIATVGVWDIPAAWVRQLKPRGVIVAPLWLEGFQYSGAFQLQPDGSLYSERNLPCGFVRLRGAAAGPRVEMRVGSGALVLFSTHAEQIDTASLDMTLSQDAANGYLGYSLELRDFVRGVVPYLIMYIQPPYHFASYYIAGEQQPYGLDDTGFAVIARGSAAFVPLKRMGNAHAFGGADALLLTEDGITAWDRAGRPTIERLRIRLTPKERGIPASLPGIGRVFERDDHYVEVWWG